MTDNLGRPADTRLMGIVHNALRRDLDRARAAISAPPFPADAQRAAIAGHLGWMMGFLHRHHESEDTWLYPEVRLRDPSAVPLLDAMDADHQRIASAITGLTEAAQAYAGSPAARDELSRALDRLTDVLYPHLRREEDEMMPSSRPASPSGNGRYRRAARRRWGSAGSAAARIPRYVQVEVTTAAVPEAVWAVLADVTRVGEWSHECHTVEWLDGATGAAPGVRFRGWNQSGWARSCTITVCDPPREFVYHTQGGLLGDSSEWRFVLEPAADGGTVIRQSFRILEGQVWADRLIWRLVPAHHDRLAALRGDLERLATLAARETASLPGCASVRT